MTEYEPQHLKEFIFIARTWHNQRDNYSPGIQDIRRRERDVGERLLRGEIEEHTEHHQQLVLRVGSKTIEAVRFSPLPYGFSTMKSLECEPDTSLPLIWLAEGDAMRDGSLEPYYGKFEYVNFPTIAQTLTEGGTLESAEADE